MSAPDFLALAAREVHGLPDEWRPCIYESLDGGFLLHGAAPLGVYSRGPRKGRPKWPPTKDLRRVIVTRAQVEIAKFNYERATGECHGCGGTGQTVKSMGLGQATTYRACAACNGSGVAAHLRERVS
jgi:hypothetical protein